MRAWPDSLTFLSVAEINKQYANIIYGTSGAQYGNGASKVTPERPVLHGCNMKFSGHLGVAGMYANNGLNTHVERERVVDYSKDWQDTNL